MNAVPPRPLPPNAPPEPRLVPNIASKTSLNEGENTTLAVAADVLDSKGTDATYTWFKDKKALKDGGTVSGAKTASLTITGATGADSGSYWCEIKNGVGTTKSTSTKLTVLLKPYASKPLRSLDLAEGKNATFSASIKGSKPLTYVWQKDGAVLDGQVKNQLKLVGVASADAGTYTVVVSNPAGSITLSADLVVIASAGTHDCTMGTAVMIVPLMIASSSRVAISPTTEGWRKPSRLHGGLKAAASTGPPPGG